MNFAYFVIIVLSVIVLISVVGDQYHQYRLARLKGMPEIDFVQYFSAQNVPAELSRMVYRVFREHSRSSKFMPSPEMSFADVFLEEPEDVYDEARDILKKLGILEIPEDVHDSWPGDKLKTLEDLTMWLNTFYPSCIRNIS